MYKVASAVASRGLVDWSTFSEYLTAAAFLVQDALVERENRGITSLVPTIPICVISGSMLAELSGYGKRSEHILTQVF